MVVLSCLETNLGDQAVATIGNSVTERSQFACFGRPARLRVLRIISHCCPLLRLLTQTIHPVYVIALVVLAAISGLGACDFEYVAPIASQVAIPLSVETERRSVTPIDLIELRDIGGHSGAISVSPDGKHVAFQIQQGDATTDRYRTGWFVASTTLNSREAVRVGDGGDVLLMGEAAGRITGARLDMNAKWSPDSQWIAYLAKHHGQVQLWRSLRDGSVQEQLTHNAANVMDFTWTADGDRLFFEVGRPRNEIRAASVREGEKGFLFDERFMVNFSTSPLLTEFVQGDPNGRGHVVGLWVYDLQHAEERLARDQDTASYEALSTSSAALHIDEDRSIRNIVRDRESGAISWLENEEPKKYAGPQPPLVVYALTVNGVEIRCDAPECMGSIGRPMWSPGGEEIYFVRQEGVNGLRRGFYAWNPNKNALRPILNTDDWIINCQAAAGWLVCLHESPTTPRKIVAIDPEDGSMRALVDPNPEFQYFEFTQVEKLEWKEASGVDAAGHLVYPIGYEAGKRYPLVIVQYRSRGFLRGGVGNEYPIHPLAANGFFVLSFDRPNKPTVRATIGDVYEREREDWGEDLWERSATLSALEIMVDRLDELGLIDPNKVGITGLSDGAETVWHAMIYSTRFAAASASSGGWSPSWYYLTNSTQREYFYKRSAELLPPGMGGDDRWKRISPEFHTGTIDTPILVQVADHELVLSAATLGALMDAGKPVETYVYPDEYHIKWHPRHKLSVYERSIDWFNFWLRGVESSNVQEVGRYERWRKLRKQRYLARQSEPPVADGF